MTEAPSQSHASYERFGFQQTMVGVRSLPLKLTWLEGDGKGRGAGDMAQGVKAVVSKPNNSKFDPQNPQKDGGREPTTKSCPLTSATHAVAHIHPHIPKTPTQHPHMQ